jgi:hypothetical protein
MACGGKRWNDVGIKCTVCVNLVLQLQGIERPARLPLSGVKCTGSSY